MPDADTLFLFDLDGVLVYPGGYKAALQATVDHFATQMGQQPVGLTVEEIAEFEACGITNEWDSSLMCVAALLVDILAQNPELGMSDIEATLMAVRGTGCNIKRPDFAALARSVSMRTPPGMPPTRTIDQIVRERAGGCFGQILDGLLTDIYSMQTSTTRVLQHYTLGSERFRQTYGLEPQITSESMLITHDTPLLDQEMLRKLVARMEPGKPGMVIYSARPSLPPPGSLSNGAQGNYSPEADLAVELLGMPANVPLVAGGAMTWLASKRGRVAADYIKPSPVQALAAIGAAQSGAIVDALQAAASLVEEDRLEGPLSLLASQPTRVVVFEDACGGIQGTRRAARLLNRAGLRITCVGIGVAEEVTKRQALAEVADRVVADVNEGLEAYLHD